MSGESSEERVEAMKEIEGGPGVEEILEAYNGDSGYARDNVNSNNYMFDSENESTYSDSSD